MDEWLFYQLNRWAGYGNWMDYATWFMDKAGLMFHFALLAVRWWVSGPRRREERYTVLLTVASGIFALGLTQIVSELMFRPRPFMVLPGAFNILKFDSTSSFPSSHAAIGQAMVTAGSWGSPRWGAFFWPYALILATSRVYAGVHYPSDLLGGSVIGILIALSLRALEPELRPAMDRIIAIVSPGSIHK